jgi:hypothetical protein
LPKGTLQELKQVSPKSLEALLKNGRIVKWGAPPLEALPGWERKSRAFEEVGVVTVADLIAADVEELSKRMNVSEDTLQGCVDEARRWVV